MKAINILEKFTKFDEYWHPRKLTVVDDMQVILAKLKGEFVWHHHEHEDELFHVIKGTLHMQFRDRTEIVNEGEIIVIPKGVEHNPSTMNGDELHVLLFEKLTTSHTGNVMHEKTKSFYPKI
jgi:mannose-6-phosphate isomerase-like protein (cupin superfamily)